jgi:type II secretory pathway pseudopilin PulG
MRRSGLTLIEVVLVTSVIVILSVVSGGWYSRFLTQSAVSNTADQIAGSLRKASAYATSGKQNSNWGVSYDNSQIVFYKGSTYPTRDASFTDVFTVNQNISVSGLTDINFARSTGIPSVIGGPGGSEIIATIVISGNNSSKIITINSQGGISK